MYKSDEATLIIMQDGSGGTIYEQLLVKLGLCNCC